MKTLIAIPCMDTVQTLFFASYLKLKKPEGQETVTAVTTSSLIYEARNTLAGIAIDGGYDRILWVDSDMTFEPDMLTRFHADLDEGRDMVCGLFFTRKNPVRPVIYDRLEDIGPDGQLVNVSHVLEDYPRDAVFPVAGCGFGAVMMKVDLLRKVRDKFGPPFTPFPTHGEDFAFCIRARMLGAAIWCDSRIKVGHAGVSIINETTWDALRGR